MENNTTDTVETAKQPVYCVPGDAGPCVNFDGTLAVPPDLTEENAVTETAAAPEQLPVEKLEVSTNSVLSSCSSCASISLADSGIFGFALLVPLVIKFFKRI